MPIHLQKLDRKMCSTGRRHETSVVLPGVPVAAAGGLPTHTSQHPASQLGWGAEVAVPPWKWAVVSSAVLCYLLSCLAAAAQIVSQNWPEGSSPDSSGKPSSLCNRSSCQVDGALSNLVQLFHGVPAHGRGVGMRWSIRSLPTQTILWFYHLCPLYRQETKDTSSTDLPPSSDEKTVLVGTWYFSVTTVQGVSSPILHGGKMEKAFVWLPPEAVPEIETICIVLSCIASHLLQR